MKAAIAAFLDAKQSPSYAVIYDVPILDPWGKPTGDTSEEFYETFSAPNEALELFRMAYRHDDRNPVENPRLVMILGPIDSYAGGSR